MVAIGRAYQGVNDLEKGVRDTKRAKKYANVIFSMWPSVRGMHACMEMSYYDDMLCMCDRIRAQMSFSHGRQGKPQESGKSLKI